MEYAIRLKGLTKFLSKRKSIKEHYHDFEKGRFMDYGV